MMKVSTKGRYGLRLMLDIAMHHDQGPVSLKDVAKRQKISEKYLWHLIAPLKHGGLITALRGSHGGYMLAKKPHEITLKNILAILEGPTCVIECAERPSSCKRFPLCIAQGVWTEVAHKIGQILESCTLENILERYKDKHTEIIYAI